MVGFGLVKTLACMWKSSVTITEPYQSTAGFPYSQVHP